MTSRAFKSLVFEISERLSEQDLLAVVFLNDLPDYSSRGSANKTAAFEIMIELHRRGVFDAWRPDGLRKILMEINRNDLAQLVQKFELSDDCSKCSSGLNDYPECKKTVTDHRAPSSETESTGIELKVSELIEDVKTLKSSASDCKCWNTDIIDSVAIKLSQLYEDIKRTRSLAVSVERPAAITSPESDQWFIRGTEKATNSSLLTGSTHRENQAIATNIRVSCSFGDTSQYSVNFYAMKDRSHSAPSFDKRLPHIGKTNHRSLPSPGQQVGKPVRQPRSKIPRPASSPAIFIRARSHSTSTVQARLYHQNCEQPATTSLKLHHQNSPQRSAASLTDSGEYFANSEFDLSDHF